MVKKLGRLKILIVEDSKVAVKSLQMHLVELGAQVIVADNGQRAIELYQQRRPDIILLDVILPDINGYQVAAKVRRLQKKEDWTAIIFLTVMAKDQDLVKGIEAGGDDYLIKPVGRVVLQAKVTAMYRLIRMQRALVNMADQLNDANQELKRLSMTDGLTGIANRRLFDEMLQREWRRGLRLRQHLSVILLDVDFFKKYNDNYGHQAGDDVLRAVAAQVSKAAPRASDLAARYGGEEFAVILGHTDKDGACWVANRLCQHVAQLQLPHKAAPAGIVTVSCGVSSIMPEEEGRQGVLLALADKALYRAKEAGRNQVSFLDSSSDA